MKKIVLIWCLLAVVPFAYSMANLILGAEEAAKNSNAFGDSAHFIQAIKELGGPIAGKLEIVRPIMENPDYAVCFDFYTGFCGVFLHKKLRVEKDHYCCVGASLFDQEYGDASNFYLRSLKVEPRERHRGLGTLLFLYAIHAVRQLSYGHPVCRITWQACPLEDRSPCAQAWLNSFYLSFGARLIDDEWNEFEWCGTPLKPFLTRLHDT